VVPASSSRATPVARRDAGAVSVRTRTGTLGRHQQAPGCPDPVRSQEISPDSLKPVKEDVPGLLDAVEESRNRQARLSDNLQENVRTAVEELLRDFSDSSRTNPSLFHRLVHHGDHAPLGDREVHDALYQATVRLVMRLIVCLFAETRPKLRFNGSVYDQSYGVKALFERLFDAVHLEGDLLVLKERHTAWPRLMALFRLVHDGSHHKDLAFFAYKGTLFRPGDDTSADPVLRALHILEHQVQVADKTVFIVLRSLLRARVPVLRGRVKTLVEGPVNYSELRPYFIGLIYEGLLDYHLKRTDDDLGPMVFLNLGREPVLPLRRLEDMLAHDRKALKSLLSTLGKEKLAGGGGSGEEEDGRETGEPAGEDGEPEEELSEEIEAAVEDPASQDGRYADAEEAAVSWAREAVVLAGIVGKQGKRETDAEYQQRIAQAARRLIKRTTSLGEYYLVRTGNTG